MVFSPFRFCLPLALLMLIATDPLWAQQDDEQFWFQLNTNVPLAKDVRVTLEQITRLSDRQDGIYMTEFGALLGYRISKQVELGFGYRRVDSHNGNDAPGENRFRQQILGNFGHFSTRLRVDERFSDAGPGIGFRIRPLLRYNLPLGKPRTALYVIHESFYLPNSTSWGQRSGYDRMRNAIGVTLPVGRYTSVDLGYLNQYRPARTGRQAQMDHALNLQITVNLTAQPTAPTQD